MNFSHSPKVRRVDDVVLICWGDHRVDAEHVWAAYRPAPGEHPSTPEPTRANDSALATASLELIRQFVQSTRTADESQMDLVKRIDSYIGNVIKVLQR